MKKIISFVFFLIFIMSLTSCGKANQKLNKIYENKEIIIITSPDYPPYEFIDSSKSGMDKYIGADIELMKYISKELGVKLKLEVADFGTTLASLNLGFADLAISGYTYEEERANNYELSVPYHNEGTQGVLVLKSNYNNLNSFDKLNTNIKIGAQDGSMQATYVKDQLPKAKLESFVSIPDGITLLDNNIISGVSLSKTTATIIMEKYPDKYAFIDDVYNINLEETSMYIMAKKGETDLIEKINEIILKVIEEGLYFTWEKEASIKAIELGLL